MEWVDVSTRRFNRSVVVETNKRVNSVMLQGEGTLECFEILRHHGIAVLG